MLRRDFFKYSALTAATITSVNATTNKKINSNNIKTRVAICGGGFAGLSCAKELKTLNPDLDVTIIERRMNFSSCPFSNAWLGNIQDISYEDLNYEYNSAILKYKYNFINATISNINIKKKIITIEKQNIEYDYLIMAVGIDYNYKKLFKRDLKKAKRCQIEAPPGLTPGSEHLKLKRMIKNFKGGNFIISIPSQSFRCPPAPYERACMIANYFKENKIDGKVIIIDPRVKPAAKPKKFVEAFNTYHKIILNTNLIQNLKI
jgi:NADPH-dependent 2,4-dienoyl-CoA reductase/sulfur reductase-like enzyme